MEGTRLGARDILELQAEKGGPMAVDEEEGWARVAALDELPDGKPGRGSLDGEELVLVRTGDRVWAGSNRCPHQGAALHRGRVRMIGETATITCAAHGSTFQLSDGRVLHPPATEPLRVYETRVVAGSVEVRHDPS